MKKLIIMFAVALLASQLAQAQGTIYLSNLGQKGTDGLGVGGFYLATDFSTGNNADGYTLNSIQLLTTGPMLAPVFGFTVMVYTAAGGATVVPGSSLGTLIGPTSPKSGISTYTAPSNLTLSPDTEYFIAITDTTDSSIAIIAATTDSYNPSDGWSAGGGVWESTDSSASSWNN